MRHLRENNETYLGHFRFAGWIGLSLILRGLIFVLHGLLPIAKIPKKFNLEVTIEKLAAWNVYSKERMKG